MLYIETDNLISAVNKKIEEGKATKEDYEKIKQDLESFHKSRSMAAPIERERDNLIMKLTDCLSKMKTQGI